ncbi:hypothetical protein [Methylorubrum thiocyanatum]|uniref:hypothetical protein n=1 Tax=Methylorubrum thiocyanatum TaxID=47958 RepID=UPI003647D781
MNNPSPKRRPQDVAALAHEYLARNRGDAVHSLHEALMDAVWLREEAEQREERLSRSISRGYVRGGLLRPQ